MWTQYACIKVYWLFTEITNWTNHPFFQVFVGVSWYPLVGQPRVKLLPKGTPLQLLSLELSAHLRHSNSVTRPYIFWKLIYICNIYYLYYLKETRHQFRVFLSRRHLPEQNKIKIKTFLFIGILTKNTLISKVLFTITAFPLRVRFRESPNRGPFQTPWGATVSVWSLVS